MKKVFLLVVLLMSVFMFSCNKKGTEAKGQVLAKVGNVTITQSDFERDLRTLPDYAQQMFSTPEGREKFIEEMVKKEILYQEALKKGYDKTPEFLKKQEDFKKLTLVSEVLEKEIMSKAKVSDQEVKEYYDKNRDDFATIKEIRASHILVSSEDDVKKVIERIKKGEKFEDIAKSVSIDKTTAKNGGDLGYFKRGQMVPEFERAASALKPGEISTPVKTQFGYHIIKVTDRKKGPVIEFEKVKDLIFQKLASDRQKDSFEKYMTELKKTYKVDINKDAIAKMSAEKTEKPVPETEKKVEKPKTPEKETK